MLKQDSYGRQYYKAKKQLPNLHNTNTIRVRGLMN